MIQNPWGSVYVCGVVIFKCGGHGRQKITFSKEVMEMEDQVKTEEASSRWRDSKHKGSATRQAWDIEGIARGPR